MVKVVETLPGVKLATERFVAVKVVANKYVDVALVEVTFVNTPVEGVVLPIGVLLIVPPLMVKLPSTNASVMEFAGREMVERTVRLEVERTVEEE